MRKHIVQRLQAILETHFLIRRSRLSYRHHLQHDLAMNRFELNEMLLYVEQNFNIQIDDGEVPTIQTVNDVVLCVLKHSKN